MYFERIKRMIGEQLQQRPDWVLVFDDVQILDQIEKYLPNQNNLNGTILITSQHKDIIWEKRWDISDGMTEHEAIHLAHAIFCLDRINQNDVIAKDNEIKQENFIGFVNCLGRLPLAISVAASHYSTVFFENKNITPDEYIDNYILITDECQKEYRILVHQNISEKKAFYRKIQEQVVAEALKRVNAPLRKLITDYSFLGGKGLDKKLLGDLLLANKKSIELNDNYSLKVVSLNEQSSLTSEQHLNLLINEKLNYSLLQKDSDNNFYIHRVTQEQALSLTKKEAKVANDNAREIFNTAICAIVEWVTNSPNNYSLLKKILPLFVSLDQYYLHWKLEQIDDIVYIHFIELIAGIYDNFGYKNTETILLKRVLKLKELSLNSSPTDLAHTLDNLGNAYLATLNLDESQHMLERAIKIKEDYYSNKEHKDLIVSLINKSALYGARGDLNIAIESIERAMNIANKGKISGSDLVAILLNKGNLYGELNNFDMQKQSYEYELKISEKIHAKQPWKIAEIKAGISNIQDLLGDFKKQITLLEEALIEIKQHYGENHWKMIHILAKLGSVKSALGEINSAKMFYEEALEILKHYFGTNNIEYAYIVGASSDIKGKKCNHEVQKDKLNDAIFIMEAQVGKNNPKVLALKE